MTFKEISKKLEIEEIKELGKLSAATKALKEARDRELEAIIKGEDDRILLVQRRAGLAIAMVALMAIIGLVMVKPNFG